MFADVETASENWNFLKYGSIGKHPICNPYIQGTTVSCDKNTHHAVDNTRYYRKHVQLQHHRPGRMTKACELGEYILCRWFFSYSCMSATGSQI